MRRFTTAAIVTTLALGAFATAQAPRPRHNKVIGLLEQKQPVFGLYAPSNRRPGGPARAGAPAMPATPDTPPKSPAELAREAAAYKLSDFVFDGSMEGDFDKAFPTFVEFAKGLAQAGVVARTPALHLTHPMIVKAPEIAPDPALAAANIGKQLNQGVSGVMLVTVETADEARQGIAAMRFKTQGRHPSRRRRRRRARGLGHDRGASTAPRPTCGRSIPTASSSTGRSSRARRASRTCATSPPCRASACCGRAPARCAACSRPPSSTGEREFDQAGWEAAIQQVLAACKEFKLACGFPANADRHRAADVAGLQRLRHELGRRRLQDRGGRPQDRRTRRHQSVGRRRRAPPTALAGGLRRRPRRCRYLVHMYRDTHPRHDDA